jgi:hypothetical protein
MPGGTAPLLGNISMSQIIAVALTPASVAANTTAEQTFTVNGIQLLDVVQIVKPSIQAGLAIGNVRVTAANTVGITYVNTTAGGLTPTAETYLMMVDRCDRSSFGITAFPNSIA